MSSLRRSSLFVLGAGLLAGGAGCLSSDATGTGTATTQVSGVRVIQVMGDAGSGVDFSLNGATAASALAFGIVAPNPAQQTYAPVAAGSSFAFNATGTTTSFFTNAGGALLANTAFTLIAYGRVTPGAAPAGTAAILADTTANSSTGVLVRIFDAVDYVTAGTGTAADVYVYPQGGTRPAAPTFAAVGYGTRSSYVSVTPGLLQVDVFAATGPHTTPLFTTTLTTSAGAVRTFILSDPAPSATLGSAGTVLILSDQG